MSRDIDAYGGKSDVIVYDDVDLSIPAPSPPRLRRRDLIPDPDMFREIDKHSVRVGTNDRLIVEAKDTLMRRW